MTPFQDLYSNMVNFISTLNAEQAVIVQILSALRTAIMIGITISILWTATQVMLNRNTSPFNEILWNMFKKAIILSVVFGGVAWMQYALPIAQEAYNLFSMNAGDTFPAMLDKNLNFLATTFWESMYDKLGFNANMFLIPIYALVTYAVFLIVALTTIVFLCLTTLTSHLLVLVLPFAIIALLYEQTKDIFAMWLKLFIANLLSVLLGFLVIETFMIKIFDTHFETLIKQPKLEISVLLILLISSLLGLKVFSMALQLAQNMVGVSLDMSSGAGAVGGAASSAVGNIAGSGTKYGTKVGSQILGKGATSIGKGTKVGSQILGKGATSIGKSGANVIGNAINRFK
ncbi:MAG: type IV secretion system protein [Campylobacter sp.]|uniref:type IV secretion system protein n=1 Tax=Campylobacter sp. TaxID=205 RepID=UPI00259D2481|nr:type IV secretion system protein [Campylobacter sp.]MBQ8609332.1 type IV secretion system protein [Campylobacter sp.]